MWDYPKACSLLTPATFKGQEFTIGILPYLQPLPAALSLQFPTFVTVILKISARSNFNKYPVHPLQFTGGKKPREGHYLKPFSSLFTKHTGIRSQGQTQTQESWQELRTLNQASRQSPFIIYLQSHMLAYIILIYNKLYYYTFIIHIPPTSKKWPVTWITQPTCLIFTTGRNSLRHQGSWNQGRSERKRLEIHLKHEFLQPSSAICPPDSPRKTVPSNSYFPTYLH